MKSRARKESDGNRVWPKSHSFNLLFCVSYPFQFSRSFYSLNKTSLPRVTNLPFLYFDSSKNVWEEKEGRLEGSTYFPPKEEETLLILSVRKFKLKERNAVTVRHSAAHSKPSWEEEEKKDEDVFPSRTVTLFPPLLPCNHSSLIRVENRITLTIDRVTFNWKTFRNVVWESNKRER